MPPSLTQLQPSWVTVICACLCTASTVNAVATTIDSYLDTFSAPQAATLWTRSDPYCLSCSHSDISEVPLP